MSEGLSSNEAVLHMINAVCHTVEIENGLGEDDYIDHIIISGQKVDKAIAFGQANTVRPALLIQSDVIFNAAFGAPTWGMSYIKDSGALVGFSAIGEVEKEMIMPKTLVMRDVIESMSVAGDSGALDFTKGLQAVGFAVSQIVDNDFDVSKLISVYNPDDNPFNFNIGSLTSEPVSIPEVK